MVLQSLSIKTFFHDEKIILNNSPNNLQQKGDKRDSSNLTQFLNSM